MNQKYNGVNYFLLFKNFIAIILIYILTTKSKYFEKNLKKRKATRMYKDCNYKNIIKKNGDLQS